MHSASCFRFLFALLNFIVIGTFISNKSIAQYDIPLSTDWLSIQHLRLTIIKSYYQDLFDKDSTRIWDQLNLSIKNKDSTHMIAAIGKILYLLGDLNVDQSMKQPLKKQDTMFLAAVIRFRKRSGLNGEGGIDQPFIRRIQYSLHRYIQMIEHNISRLQSIEPFEGMCLLVNIPDFKLYVIKKGAVMVQYDVIVGTTSNQTISFSAQLNSIVFHPYWYVPPGILQKEILPVVKRNPGYLKKNQMEWYGKGIRQLPGPDNALGKLKFQFPNRYNIYIHDTPNKHLFSQRIRAFSHGCIRLKQAANLASMILVENEGWSNKQFDEAWGNGIHQIVPLMHPVPVRITYLTAFADEWGRLQLRDDIYRLD